MNIFFILTDSICNFDREDEKGLLDTYKELIKNKEGFYFSNSVSLFPSTILSISSIFTGKFPYSIFPEFYEDLGNYKLYTYFEDFKKHKYNIKSIICWNLGNTLLKDFLNPVVDESLFEGDRQLEAKEIYELFKKEIKKTDFSKNNFFYIHFRAGDKEMDIYTRKIVNYLKEHNLWKNSITIITADHGYFYKKKYKKIKLLHFDDIHQTSISPATFIRFPKKLTKALYRIIDKRIYLIDILETVLDYLKIEPSVKNRNAKSFKNIIEKDEDINKNRLVRVDAYLSFQPVKKTAILKNNWKLIYDKEKFKLINLSEDPLERIDIKKSNKEVYEELYNFYLKTEEKSFEEAKQILEAFFKNSNLSKISSEKIFIPKKQFPLRYVEFLIEKLSKKNKIVNYSNKKKELTTILVFNRLTGYGIKRYMRKYNRGTKKFLIVDLKFEEIPKERYKEIGFLNFVITNLKKRKKILLQRPFDIILWIFYMPLYFNKYIKKCYK